MCVFLGDYKGLCNHPSPLQIFIRRKLWLETGLRLWWMFIAGQLTAGLFIESEALQEALIYLFKISNAYQNILTFRPALKDSSTVLEKKIIFPYSVQKILSVCTISLHWG